MNKEKIGFKACLNAIGEDYAIANKDNMIFSCSETAKGLFCFLGITEHPYESDVLCLRKNEEDWDYYASCYVLENNDVVMDKCKLPSLV